ncbi:MAG: tyrosine-protein phosphatase [Bacilli bacterium]|nr:tyrosine-protein phosphatase [Bacilli bacterium]
MNKNYRVLFSLASVILLTACSAPSGLKVTGSTHFTEVQEAYLKSSNIEDTTPYNGNMSLSAPAPTVLKWSGSSLQGYVVNIYKDKELKDLAFSYTTKKTSLEFYNEELNKVYYWNVTDKASNKVSETHGFQNIINVAGPRNLNIDGVENFRDIGGWGVLTDQGYQRYMKQGMVYRSGRFNEDKADEVNITASAEGIREAKENLKIKTEIDFRRSSNNEIGSLTSSALGEGVNYYNLPMLYEGKNLLTFTGKSGKDTYEYNNPAMIKQFFEILSDENNYPVNFHCSIGKDRTGCLAFLLEGLLGFDQEVMNRDYMFTNFANAGMCKLQDDIYASNRYGYTLENYENGSTINEKIYNYLKDVIGVEAEKLDNIISILKVDYIDPLN